MPRSRHSDPAFRCRRFEQDIIILCVRWYISYRLSYRDLVEMMAERGINVAPSTIYRWVQHFVPEFEKRWNGYSKSIGSSWRVDETYILIKKRWHYLYRAVDKQGQTIDFLLRPDRGIEAAKAFFRKALESNLGCAPRKVTLDGHVPSHRALRLLRRERRVWRRVQLRSSKYLNNIVEQDHRAVKGRCAPMMGFKSFDSASTTNWRIAFARSNSRWITRAARVGSICTRRGNVRCSERYEVGRSEDSASSR